MIYAYLFRVLVIILLTVHGIWMMLHVTVHYKSSQHLILQITHKTEVQNAMT